jgi:ATP-dependent DNA helicase DinG
MEISLPDASLRLVQACGRLIRTESDSGKITIFDNRLKTKFYGKQLLDNLPGYNIIIEK